MMNDETWEQHVVLIHDDVLTILIILINASDSDDENDKLSIVVIDESVVVACPTPEQSTSATPAHPDAISSNTNSRTCVHSCMHAKMHQTSETLHHTTAMCDGPPVWPVHWLHAGRCMGGTMLVWSLSMAGG